MHCAKDIVEVSVTKSRPGQIIGLDLEEEFGVECNSSWRSVHSRKIFVAGISGLFLEQDTKLCAGDELLEINGIPVSEFHGLIDVKRFLKGEWSINVKVGRNHINNKNGTDEESSDSTTSRIATTTSHLSLRSQQQQQQANGDNGNDEETRSRYSRAMINPLSDGSMSLSGHSKEEGVDDAPSTPTTKKRRGRRKSRESLGSLIRDVQGRSRTPSDRPRRGKRPSRSKSNPNKHEKRNSSSKSIANSNEDSGHSRSASKKKKTKKDKKPKSTTSTSSTSEKSKESSNDNSLPDTKIQGVQCSGTEVTLQMNNGRRVSVDPEALMALMTEEDGKFVAISNRALLDSTPPRAIPVSDDESDWDEEDGFKPPLHLEAPNLQDLRNRLHNITNSEGGDLNATNPSKELFKNQKNSNHSLSHLVKDPWIRRSMTTLQEDDNSNNSCNGQRPPSPGSLSLRGLLGARLKTTNPKKWEDSSMVSSTIQCMTNLIDPGDLMKIRNFAARPGLNGATVEIVQKSTKCIGNRWDVRIIKRKANHGNQRASTSNLETSNKLVSVAAENLRHFM